jgi:hypothetical protein
MDKLKDFIQNHRLDFDDQQPSEENWEKILQRLDKETESQKEAKTIPLDGNWFSQIKTLRIAAAVLLLMVGGMGVYIVKDMMKAPQVASRSVRPKTPISPELQQAETYYTQLISQKEAELKKIDSKEADFCTIDMESLDKEYADLKTQLLQDINNQQITDVMIRNLQTRMQILNRQLNTLQKIKERQQNMNSSVEKISM